jgi:hypothetical protein
MGVALTSVLWRSDRRYFDRTCWLHFNGLSLRRSAESALEARPKLGALEEADVMDFFVTVKMATWMAKVGLPTCRQGSPE